MEFWTGVRIVLARWPITAAGLALTTLLGVFLVGSMAPRYDVTGSVVLLRLAPVPGKPTNPWESADNSASNFALLVTGVTNGPEFKEGLEARGGPADFTITNSINGTPVLTITVFDDTPQGASEGYDVLVATLRDEIRQQQVKVQAAEETFYSAVNLATPSEPVKTEGSRILLGVVVAVLGFITSIGLALAVDRFKAPDEPAVDGPGPDDNGYGPLNGYHAPDVVHPAAASAPPAVRPVPAGRSPFRPGGDVPL